LAWAACDGHGRPPEIGGFPPESSKYLADMQSVDVLQGPPCRQMGVSHAILLEETPRAGTRHRRAAPRTFILLAVLGGVALGVRALYID